MYKKNTTSRYLNAGFIQMSRSLVDHPLSPKSQGREFTEFEAFEDMLRISNYMDTKCNDLTIKRGQILRKDSQLAERWNWSSEKVELFKEKLKQLDEIQITVLASGTEVVTMLNYDEYCGKRKRHFSSVDLGNSESEFSL